MARDSQYVEFDDEPDFEFSPENVAKIKRLALQVVESGLVPEDDSASADYIRALLPV
ncbi:hypothetical protein ACLBXX_02840 [Microbacterium sp. C23T]